MGELPWMHEAGRGGALKDANALLCGLAKQPDAEGAVRPKVAGANSKASAGDDDEDEDNVPDSLEKRLAMEVIVACFREDPKERPTVSQLTTFAYFM